MNRQDIYNLINSIIPTLSVGQLSGTVTKNCAILRRGVDLPSLSNDMGYLSQWNIDIYSPNSPLEVDRLVNALSSTLRKNDFQVENLLSGDYYDPILKAFSTTLTIRSPKTIN